MTDDAPRTRVLSRVVSVSQREVVEHPSDLIAIKRAQVQAEIEDATSGMEIIPPIWVGHWEDGKGKVHVAAKVTVVVR